MIDGWLPTGDVVETNDANEWRIVDRKKDIMITSGGKNIAPSEIENLLKSSPYISEAALIGSVAVNSSAPSSRSTSERWPNGRAAIA